MQEILRENSFNCSKCRVAVDVMHGKVSEIFPDILTEMEVNNVIFNAHLNEQRLCNFKTLVKQSKEDISDVVKALHLTAGFMIYPDEQRLDIVCDKGNVLEKQTALDAVLSLLNMDAKAKNITKRVLLPTWACDITYFEYLEIDRGKYDNFKAHQMQMYDLIATGDGNFSFTEFTLHRDSMYATLKILELMSLYQVSLSEIVSAIPSFYYHSFKIECSQALKGKMMRMFLEDAQGKQLSTIDGVKIWFDTDDWILMIPDQYNEHLNLYIQAKDKESGEKILAEYNAKIQEWLK